MSEDPRHQPRGQGTELHAGHIARMKREHEAEIEKQEADQDAALEKAAKKSAAIRRGVAAWGLVGIGLWKLLTLVEGGDPKAWIAMVVLGGAIMSVEQILTAIGKR